jgi:hypothetical protein
MAMTDQKPSRYWADDAISEDPRPTAPVPARLTVDPEFAALPLNEMLEQNTQLAMCYINTRLKIANPADPDTQRLKADTALALATMSTQLRVDEQRLRVNQELADEEQRRITNQFMEEMRQLVRESGRPSPFPDKGAPEQKPASTTIELEALLHDKPIADTPLQAPPVHIKPAPQIVAPREYHEEPTPPSKTASDRWMNQSFDAGQPKTYASIRRRS